MRTILLYGMKIQEELTHYNVDVVEPVYETGIRSGTEKLGSNPIIHAKQYAHVAEYAF